MLDSLSCTEIFSQDSFKTLNQMLKYTVYVRLDTENIMVCVPVL